ncbi:MULTISPECIES: hypothetical protein [unclassified Streptomyces]|uniref:hypothetical protein n=1 Tax=unclassified Streptomyces TaxID=2593676 RepID=UPI00331C179A
MWDLVSPRPTDSTDVLDRNDTGAGTLDDDRAPALDGPEAPALTLSATEGPCNPAPAEPHHASTGACTIE